MSVLQDFSVTMERNEMKFGGIIAPNSGSLNLNWGPCSSCGFGVVNVLLSRFDVLFKCSADSTLQMLITLCSNKLCN